MRYSLFVFLAAIVSVFAGCSSLDTTPQPMGERMLSGTINCRGGVALPPGAVVTVRLLDATQLAVPGQILEELTLSEIGKPPIPFRLGYKAEDIQPPHRVRLEARVAVDGKLRFYSKTAYPVTPGNADDQFELWLDAVAH